VFVMICAEPHTDWLAGVLHLDERGFILTARDIPGTNWALERKPHSFETSRPGVFAAGDVRTGSVKRVAGAVGEGSVAVGSVHRYLAEPHPLTSMGSPLQLTRSTSEATAIPPRCSKGSTAEPAVRTRAAPATAPAEKIDSHFSHPPGLSTSWH
jgi:hypothetical protein